VSARRVRRPLAVALLLAVVTLLAWGAVAQDQAPRREVQPSRTAPALQDEIRPRVLAAAAARLDDPACRRSAVVETSFNGWSDSSSAQSAPGDAWEAGWEETWVVDVCGRIVDVLVLFAPGPQGVAVQIPARSVHLRP